MAKVLVVGLNPAWQTILEFTALAPGEVNRASSSDHFASGKGFNVAKVLRGFGHEVWLLQILGGANGIRCQADCDALGIHSVTGWVESETRQCLTLLDAATGLSTELIEPFQVHSPGLAARLLEDLPLDAGAFDALVLAGTVPTGLEGNLPAEVLARYNCPVTIVDAWNGLDAASLSKSSWIKINASEWRILKTRLESSANGPFFGPGGFPRDLNLAITSGPEEAIMVSHGKVTARISPPVLVAAVNPIGAGDTVTAGLTHYLLEGAPAHEAFRQALALGSASCLRRRPSEYDEADYKKILLRMALHRA